MHLINKFILSLALILLLSACDDKTFSKIYPNTPESVDVKTVTLLCIYPDVSKIVQEALKESNFNLQTTSEYSIKVDYMNYKKACNNPMTSAYDATYDGFIRLTLLKENRRIYYCQKDYRGELSVSTIENLLTLMRDDLEF